MWQTCLYIYMHVYVTNMFIYLYAYVYVTNMSMHVYKCLYMYVYACRSRSFLKCWSKYFRIKETSGSLKNFFFGTGTNIAMYVFLNNIPSRFSKKSLLRNIVRVLVMVRVLKNMIRVIFVAMYQMHNYMEESHVPTFQLVSNHFQDSTNLFSNTSI